MLIFCVIIYFFLKFSASVCWFSCRRFSCRLYSHWLHTNRTWNHFFIFHPKAFRVRSVPPPLQLRPQPAHHPVRRQGRLRGVRLHGQKQDRWEQRYVHAACLWLVFTFRQLVSPILIECTEARWWCLFYVQSLQRCFSQKISTVWMWVSVSLCPVTWLVTRSLSYTGSTSKMEKNW